MKKPSATPATPPLTRADRLRRHAIIFQHAQTRNITPREAELELDHADAQARHQATQARLSAKIHGRPEPPTPPPTAPVQWWQKD